MLDLKKLLYRICRRLYNIGEHHYNGPSEITTGTGKYYKVAITDPLRAGTWILMGHVWFEYKNTNGFRRGYITAENFSNGTTTAPANYAMAGYQEFAASAFGSGRADVKAGPLYVNITDPNQTFYLVAYQTSGANVSATGRIYAIQIA